MKIGITGCGKYENYRKWIAEAVPSAEIIRLGRGGAGEENVAGLDGIVLSGGEDVDPARYDKPEYLDEFGLEEIDPARDEVEYQVLKRAFAEKIPILGICRGLQLANVFLGGTLIPDLPAVRSIAGHGKIAGVDQRHPVTLEKNSVIARATGLSSGTVNSAHHQSADRPAGSLVVTAHSEGGIVEAMEWKDPGDRSWLLLVQWHPERMPDRDNPLSAAVRTVFLEHCKR